MRALALFTTLALLSWAVGGGLFGTMVSADSHAVTTEAATGITASDATMNGSVGMDDATGTAFWVSTSSFSVASSASPTLPDGVHSTGDLGAAASSTSFSALLSEATIPGPITITPDTTYHFVAWVLVDGTWVPGEVLTFDTLPLAPTISGISPVSGSASGGTAVTITGTGFTGATDVNFGATDAASFTVDSDTSITATTSAGSGAVNVTVTTAGGTSATSSADVFTFTVDVLAPTIDDIVVTDIDEDSATISWSTDVAADGEVNYGTSTAYGSTSAGGTATTSHSVTLTGLEEGTVYHFQVAADNIGGSATSSDQTFVTLSTASSTPLALDDTEAIDTNGIANDEWEDGWEWVLTFTVPDNETQFQMRFSDFEDGDESIAADGNIRYFTSQSASATTSADAVVIDEENVYADAITLTGDVDPGTPGRQVEVTIQVKIPIGTDEGSYSTTFGARTDTP